MMSTHDYYFKDFAIFFDEWLVNNISNDFYTVDLDGYKLDVIAVLKASGEYEKLLHFYKTNVLTLSNNDDYEFINDDAMMHDTFNDGYERIDRMNNISLACRYKLLYADNMTVLEQVCIDTCIEKQDNLYVFKDDSSILFKTEVIVL